MIQTNLQVIDTPRVSAEQLARNVVELEGNVLVVNVGGIYAWYQSRALYHHISEWLPKEKDLLGDIVRECRKRRVKVVARFDFSKADDSAYLRKPQWSVRNPDGTPHAYGIGRTDPWSILYSTCINGGYGDYEVAVPALKETLKRYELGGVFPNTPDYEPCSCESCRKKYRQMFGEELSMEWENGKNITTSPAFARRKEIKGTREGWESLCYRDSIRLIRESVQAISPGIPLILYLKTYGEDLGARVSTVDMLCAETQDILSQRIKNIIPFWLPSLNAKYGSVPEHMPAPPGIIHSCPEMDWRHAGLPETEYRSWMSWIAANGANLQHSLTGFKETTGDQRLLRAIKTINQGAVQMEMVMNGTKNVAQVLVVWNNTKSAEGWIGGLLNTQIQFDIEDEKRLGVWRTCRYQAVIIPLGGKMLETRKRELEEYVRRRVNLLIEEHRASWARESHEFLGIKEEVQRGGELKAAYWGFETDSLQRNLEETLLLSHQGEILYYIVKESSVTEATLVPPFAPLDTVGAPPERTGIPVQQAQLPLCMTYKEGDGAVSYLPFAFDCLLREYGLPGGLRFLENVVDWALKDPHVSRMELCPGLETVLYQTQNGALLHLINPIEGRPLMKMVPLVGVEFNPLLPPGVSGADVKVLLGPRVVIVRSKERILTVSAARVKTWSTFEIVWKKMVPIIG